MMPSNDQAGPAGTAGLQAILAGLDLKPEQLDDRARQQAALLAFGRRSNAQPPMGVLMEDAAAITAEILGVDRIGVGEVVSGGTAIALRVAGISKQGTLVNVLTHQYAAEAAQSMAGYALEMATPISSSNLATEKRFTDLFLRKLDVVTALTMPLHFNGRPFGVLGLYACRERPFGLDDVQFAETIAHLLTSSLARIKAEEELDQQRSFASTVLEMVDTLVLTLDAEGRVVGMNRATHEVTGFSIDEIRNRPFWSVFVVPEELDLIQGIFRSSRREKAPCEFEGYVLAKDGGRKRVSWSMKLMSDGKVQSILLSGVDQTEKVETQAKLQQATTIALKATKALKELCSMTEAKETPVPDSDRLSVRDDSSELRPFQPVGGQGSIEQRISIRRSYRYEQRIAPMVGDALPDRKLFFEVQCNDISAGGISFFVERAPTYENVVVALGKPPALSYFRATVVRVASVQKDGATVYLVGCRFAGRVRY
jgi:PAS domain S-box-containing protein